MKTLNLAILMLTLTGCVTEPESTTFVLTNDGDSDIFHDANPRWMSLEVDGRPASFFEPGCMARCGALSGPIMCALAAEYPTVMRVRPGEQSITQWDGTYYEVPEGRDCFRERKADAEFSVSFCYSHEYEAIDGELGDVSGDSIGGAMVKDPVCEKQSFVRGEEVELLAE